ncbi:hypothetical protein UFOVP84_39 [uncultured Caudovirales phage]|uniref:Uncharacterized protein n=1 Tax=uncultured Caudovirales phage TaxID=2100421 RepID=A0A6J5L031_9CAUD|nr:hypothetical protein UFOVP84_39 [uncultured Caudovirales phage]
MISKDIYTPYFYIIQHKETKKMYAGSKWAKGCHPDEFMQPNGYTTSSNIINSIIEQDGLDYFEILRIDTNCDGLHPYDYETLFLETIDCASSPDWYNGHNNKFIRDKLVPFGSVKYNMLIKLKYGVSNCMHIEEVKLKQKFAEKKTLMEKYGVNHNMKIPGVAINAAKTRVGIWKLSETGRSPLFGRTGDMCAGTGVYHNISDEGRRVLSENGKRRKGVPNPKSSKYQKEQGNFINDNPMNDPEKRKLVSLSKIGKKAYIHPDMPNKRKMFLPENAPVDWVLLIDYKKD